MVLIFYKETLGQELRRKHKIPHHVRTEHIWDYIAERITNEIIEKLKMKVIEGKYSASKLNTR